jgi:hypothetical protein
MNLYICDKCGKNFHQKSHYVRHLTNKKKFCYLKYEHPNNTCKYCNHSFTRYQSLIVHLKTCKKQINNENINNNNTNELKNNINQIVKDNMDLKNKLENIENMIINGTTQNKNKIQNQIKNQNQININNPVILNNPVFIVNHKDSKIDDDDFNSILNDDNPVLCAVEKMHCNKNIPEQQNILINDKTRNNIYVYENNNWILKNKRDVLRNVYCSAMNQITNKINNDNKNFEDNFNVDIKEYYNGIKTKKFVHEKRYFFISIINMKKHSMRLNDVFYNNKIMISKNKIDNAIMYY